MLCNNLQHNLIDTEASAGLAKARIVCYILLHTLSIRTAKRFFRLRKMLRLFLHSGV